MHLPQAQARSSRGNRASLQYRTCGSPLHRGFTARLAGSNGRRCTTHSGADRQGQANAGCGRSAAQCPYLCESRRGSESYSAMSVLARSCLFAAFQLLVTPPFAVIALLTFPFDPFTRYRIIRTWTRLVLWAVERICGVRYRVLGADNIPPRACVILSK